MSDDHALHMDFSKELAVNIDQLAWHKSPMPGVERRKLERVNAETGHTTSIVRYQAYSKFSAHTNTGGEEFFVLHGTFSDNSGDFSEGYYVRNPPGSSHAPFTRKGCTIFVKLCQMQMRGEPYLRVNTHDKEWLEAQADGSYFKPLFENAFETVQINKLASDTQLDKTVCKQGLEFLLLAGDLTINEQAYTGCHWGRVPVGKTITLSSQNGCVYWTKEKHLLNR